MRYDYECQHCGRRQEISCSMSARTETVPCQCGLEAISIITAVPECFVRFREYQFDKAKNVGSSGRIYGRSDAEQHEHYKQAFDRQRSQAKAERRGFSKAKGQCEWIGGMPGEMVDSIGEHEGDPEAVIKDPVTFLKKTGLYAGS